MKKRYFEVLLVELVADELAQLAGVVRELAAYAPVMAEARYGGVRERNANVVNRKGIEARWYERNDFEFEVRWYEDVVKIVTRWPDDDDGLVIGSVRCNADDLDAAARAAAREIVQAIEGMPEPGAAVLRALDRAIMMAVDRLRRAEEAWEVHQARAAWAMREILNRLTPGVWQDADGTDAEEVGDEMA